MISLVSASSRLKLFNWVAALLITSWVLVVAIMVETTEDSAKGEVTSEVFIEDLLS